MAEDDDFEDQLRHRLVGLLHAGRLKPGDRLTSIRQLSRESGVDHRVVAEAYRSLQAEGLVEVREGSGVYVGPLGQPNALSSERVRWMSEFLHAGWKRGWSRREVGKLVRRAGSRKVRCALIESNEDHMEAFGAELSSGFELELTKVILGDQPDAEDLLERARDADFIATSAFHTALALKLSASTTKPVVVLTIDPEYSLRIDQRLRQRRITTVAVDPRYIALGRQHLIGTDHEGNVDLLTLEEAQERKIDLNSNDVLLTRSARRRLGMEEFHLLPPPPCLISSASARSLLDEITRLAIR